MLGNQVIPDEAVEASAHRPLPELVEAAHRWRCKVCKSWVNYSEANVKWWHEYQ